jgi:uncharacterized OB-fold protein
MTVEVLEAVELDERGLTEVGHRPDLNYWRGLALGQLWMTRCVKCREFLWPAPWRCKHCGSFGIDWEQVEARGTIYSWIRTHYPFHPGYADRLPYVNVLVEVPHAGKRRLFGMLLGSTEETAQVAIGEPVRGVFEPACEATSHLPTLRWERT